MDTPAIPLEIGNCSTVASLAMLLPITFAFGLLQLELEGRQLLAGEQRVGDVVHEARVAGVSSPGPDQGGGRGGGEGRGPGQKVSALEVGHGISLLEDELRTPSLHCSCGNRIGSDWPVQAGTTGVLRIGIFSGTDVGLLSILAANDRPITGVPQAPWTVSSSMEDRRSGRLHRDEAGASRSPNGTSGASRSASLLSPHDIICKSLLRISC